MDISQINTKNEINSSEENTAKNKAKTRAKKRKRINSDSSTESDVPLPENALEVEINLHASAIKNNLDDVSVKKILKKVVTNDHVLALVKLREEEEKNSGLEDGLSPKLTRAKAKELRKVKPKELMKVSPRDAPWTLELTPIKHIPVKTRPEVKALIAQELPEDEDDEEYEPTPDDVMSDDDHILESCSDIESQPRTPATPRSQNKTSPKIVKDGPFKVPQEVSSEVSKKLDFGEEATIALRTRSKLSLSATPIEHIESSFIPPDYLPVPHVDDLWKEFLTDCLNPAPNVRNEDDDETDPEYSVAADPDAHEEDEEALENSIIKISKKELEDLVNELFHVMPEDTDKQLTDVLNKENNTEAKTVWEGKQEPQSDEEPTVQAAKVNYDRQGSKSRFSIGKNEPVDIEDNDQTFEINTETAVEDSITDKPTSGPEHACEVNSSSPAGADEPAPPAPLRALLQAPPLTLRIQLDRPVEMYPEQVLILQQQLRQHIQLCASNYLQLYIHPVHWSYAPKYKEYLESLIKISKENSKSVVDVCNLKPAMDLIESWESSVSEDSPETVEMVEFIQKEIEKFRRRINQNGVYVGDFHEIFKKVVANSSVFLYPYLLPPLPYRGEFTHKRFNYLLPEDKLIVLGMDQFWWYVDNNPELFKKPQNNPHPRHRWGFSIVARLVCRHLLPGVSQRALQAHVMTVRKSGARNNPIVKYFEDNIIEPVKHRLLPFNPKITLYEHPEFEMPRLWVKYLAKNSKRFKDHLYKRKSQQPAGVDIEIGQTIESIERPPLPIEFTKQITRVSVLPPKPKQILVDKVDVHIEKPEVGTTVLVASNVYTLVTTSTGTQLIPLTVETNTVNSASTPICSAAEVNTNKNSGKTPEINDKAKDAVTTKSRVETARHNIRPREINNRHCKCCNLFRKIKRKRQTTITEYFNSNKKHNNKNKINICDCGNKTYPRITNKLKLLVNNYKTLSRSIFNDVVMKIEECYTGLTSSNMQKIVGDPESYAKDFVSAITFLVKLVERSSKTKRNILLRKTVHTAFSKFDIYTGDPVALSQRLFKIFDFELIDMYKEFLGFLTPEQAVKIDQFKEYFLRNCVEDLVAKTEEHVSDIENRVVVLENIRDIFLDIETDPCEICCKLLVCVKDYPALAQYIYSLFPHRRIEEDTCSESEEEQEEINAQKDVDQQEEQLGPCKENNTADYEADDSSSDEETEEVEDEGPSKESQPTKENEHISYDEETENTDMVADERVQRHNESPDYMSTLVMSEDELKSEIPDWKREEDKLILEVLKRCISPEEMKDKTIIEIIEEKNVVNKIAESLSHKSFDDVRGRILYLLEILVNDNDN